ncbi:hypothetical protein STEG23_032122 [Scotinomys teguina]
MDPGPDTCSTAKREDHRPERLSGERWSQQWELSHAHSTAQTRQPMLFVLLILECGYGRQESQGHLDPLVFNVVYIPSIKQQQSVWKIKL